MKKYLLLLIEYLANFWFMILILIIACFLVIFFDPSGAIISFGKNWDFGKIAEIIGRFWSMFFFPLAILSMLLSALIWLKYNPEESYRGLSSLVIILLAVALIFLFITKLAILDASINSGDSIFSLNYISRIVNI